MMTEICLVHLVWRPLGLAPFRAFLDSYRRSARQPAHRLVIAFNGFRRKDDLKPYHALLADLPHDWFRIAPPMQDIPAYFAAAERYECRYFCFVNSYCVLLDGDWLAKLYEQVRRSDVGAVGATGSWNSHHSWDMYTRGKTSAYTEIMSGLTSVRGRPQTFGLTRELKDAIQSAPWPNRYALRFYYYGLAAPYYHVVNSVRFSFQHRAFSAASFDPFPAPHLRTNAFMISREVMLRLERGRLRTKIDAYRFESGRTGMTRQLQEAGLKVLIVGRDGRPYEWDEWPQSETLFQGEQRNLLVSDNQTRHYGQSDSHVRTFLARLAWGHQAAPAAPPKVERSFEKGRRDSASSPMFEPTLEISSRD